MYLLTSNRSHYKLTIRHCYLSSKHLWIVCGDLCVYIPRTVCQQILSSPLSGYMLNATTSYYVYHCHLISKPGFTYLLYDLIQVFIVLGFFFSQSFIVGKELIFPLTWYIKSRSKQVIFLKTFFYFVYYYYYSSRKDNNNT